MSQSEWVTTDDHRRFSSNTNHPFHDLTPTEVHDHFCPPYQYIQITPEADR